MAETLTRRRFLGKTGFIACGATVVVAGGLAGRAWEQGSLGNIYGGPAFEPWRAWRSGRHRGSLAVVAAAILASNPHNSQPWLYRVGERRVELFADPARNLGTIDPFRREMHLGLGCAVENMALAARGLGYRPHVALRPHPAHGALIARVDLTESAPEASVHFRAIPERHTNRAAYERGRLLPRVVLSAFGAQVASPDTRLILLDAASAEGTLFAEATVHATRQFVADAEMSRDSHRWFRHALDEVNRYRDGVTTLAAGLPESTLRLALMMPRRLIGDPGQAWLAATRDRHCRTAPMFGLIAVRNPADVTQLFEAGRLWQRVHLEAVGQGVAMQPLNQLMEIADRERALGRSPEAARHLARMVGDDRFRTVFGFRCGYAVRPAPPSPRRGVNAVLIA
ncbi:MAG: hypothetical protein DMD82_13475 [Candidatus Rokuibacteriota bacterium]|nr:MAG: hypothetical protein DMD82_13475 [Candidatus Rokubacteria bacterium]